MAKNKEYFEKDFSDYTRLEVAATIDQKSLKGYLYYDFNTGHLIPSIYIPENNSIEFLELTINRLTSRQFKFIFKKNLIIGSDKHQYGDYQITNKPDEIPCIEFKFLGDNSFISANEMPRSKRFFIYTDMDLTVGQIDELKSKCVLTDYEPHIRSTDYKKRRNLMETPVAFISHDSRDKESIVKPIVYKLTSYMTSVWYDEYSLKVGDNLRESIEKGLKECKKCILILTPNFLANNGWTKVEFNSIFTREIIEEKKLILPVWSGISSQEVFEYSPSLASVVGLNFEDLGVNTVCKKLFQALEN